MTGAKFNELLKKYGIGELIIDLSDGEYECSLEEALENDCACDVLMVKNNQPTEACPEKEIRILSASFVQGKGKKPDLENLQIDEVLFKHPSWAYPSGEYEYYDEDRGIRLSDLNPDMMEIRCEQAFEMYCHPLEYQTWLLESFISSFHLLFSKFYTVLTEEGFDMLYNTAFLSGVESECSSELYILFEDKEGECRVSFTQDIFTGELMLDTGEEVRPSVSELTEEELRAHIKSIRY